MWGHTTIGWDTPLLDTVSFQGQNGIVEVNFLSVKPERNEKERKREEEEFKGGEEEMERDESKRSQSSENL